MNGQKNSAIGMAEFVTISAGLAATDEMVKHSPVDIVFSDIVTPGKLVVIIDGELSAVNMAIDTVRNRYRDALAGSYVIGNPHPEVRRAVRGDEEAGIDTTTDTDPGNADVSMGSVGGYAVGILETKSVVSGILGADACTKAAAVSILRIRLRGGMGGKAFVLMRGSVANVEAAVAAGIKAVGRELADYSVLPRPDGRVVEMFYKSLNSSIR